MKRRWCLALIAVCCSVFLPAGSASAHAGLEGSEPKPSSWLATSPTEVVLYFDEPVGVVFARIQILDQDGNEVFETRPTRDADDHTTVRANIDKLGDGTWVVVWRIASADSHPVQGSFAFSIGSSPSDVTNILNNDAGQRHGLNNLFNIIRFVMFAGILTLLGGVAMVMFGAQKSPSIRTRMSLWGAWTFAIVASIQALFAYGPHASGVKVYNITDLSLLSDTMTTTFGQATLIRIALLLGFSLLLMTIESRGKRPWRLISWNFCCDCCHVLHCWSSKRRVTSRAQSHARRSSLARGISVDWCAIPHHHRSQVLVAVHTVHALVLTYSGVFNCGNCSDGYRPSTVTHGWIARCFRS